MTKDRKNYSILVIEDNPGDFTLIEVYLEEQITIPRIHHVKNFKEARSLLSDERTGFDVILLDLSLPDKSGEELITDIISISSGIPVIVLTGYADIEFSIRSLSLGVADYLFKDDINATSLYKSIVYNIERKKTNIELKESEKRYNNLFNLSPQPMWVYDPANLQFVQVNKAAIKHYGYTEEEFLGMTILDIRPAEDVPLFKEQLSNGEPYIRNDSGRYRHLTKSNELLDVEIYSTTIIINDKEYRSVIAIDVTERILLEHKITKAIIKTQEDERYEFGSELHDNVCQILATCHITLGMIKKSLNESAMPWFDQCNEYILLASKEARNLSHRLAPAFFDDSTLEDTFRLLLESINVANEYQVHLYFDEGVNNYPLNREIQLNLYRILQEQLRNIIKYAKATTIEVDMMLHHNELMMRVSDNGIGFDSSTVKKGIGLANMKRRAELFSGKLAIDSSPGKGCDIIVRIPLRELTR